MAALPWEAALPPGQAKPLALSSAVQVYWSVPRPTVAPDGPPEPASRLRFLGAFSDPVRGPDADDPVLDLAADLHRILGAAGPGLRAGTVEFDVLDRVDTLAVIGRIVRRQRYDILHLSCHARAGRLLLENGTGRADSVSADRLISAFSPSRVPSPAVLAGCSSGAGPEGGGNPGSEEWARRDADLPEQPDDGPDFLHVVSEAH
ncbi:CHAT domain-containing protein [Streptomyces sp. CA-249302]|uniref:CHAT domain-containing protein n=1 Tax=Streptomyces sp. CA-249302 TaxID=3240058 RepID=UPI003D8FACC4